MRATQKLLLLRGARRLLGSVAGSANPRHTAVAAAALLRRSAALRGAAPGSGSLLLVCAAAPSVQSAAAGRGCHTGPGAN
jgi:hypothetical protein